MMNANNGIINVIVSTCFLFMVYDVTALPGKQIHMDGRKLITGGESLSTEELPDDVYLENANVDDLQQIDYPNYVAVNDPEVVKRFLGRWRNRNWILRQRQEKTLGMPVGKRFFGRWMNRNYILSKLQAERENRSRLAAERENRLRKRFLVR
ncbi:uncharacterized protein LOC117344577 [Pecten maximus]|uniref:uncharacterized protein LOC117344577 n=1 Tax=Pecten maximus TaxID=6579 RepID=UPI001459156D|nr:uncharacterized protein LOC117344577 [Pecten maximus]